MQHSIIYFFHHYELPAILQQADLQERMNNNRVPAPRSQGAAAASVRVLNQDRNSPEASQNLATELHAILQNEEEPQSLESNSSAVQISTQESNREEQPGGVNSDLYYSATSLTSPLERRIPTESDASERNETLEHLNSIPDTSDSSF